MDCSEFQAIVAGEHEEDLAPAESDAFEAHLESCAACREAVTRAEEDLERLAHAADPPLVAASAWARIDDMVRAQAQKKPGREDPFAPLADPIERVAAPAVALKVLPAMPLTRPAATGTASRIVLALAAVAAAVIVALGFFGATPITKVEQQPEVVDLRVKGPEPGDVKIENLEAGKSVKVLEKQGKLIWVLEGE